MTSSFVSLCGDGKSILLTKYNTKLIKPIIIKPYIAVPRKGELFFDLKFNLGCIVFKIYLNSEIKTNLW